MTRSLLSLTLSERLSRTMTIQMDEERLGEELEVTVDPSNHEVLSEVVEDTVEEEEENLVDTFPGLEEVEGMREVRGFSFLSTNYSCHFRPYSSVPKWTDRRISVHRYRSLRGLKLFLN